MSISDNAARQSGSGIARFQTFVISTTTQVVGLIVHNQCPTHDAVHVIGFERNCPVGQTNMRHAEIVGPNVAEVASVADFVGRPAVGHIVGIEVIADRGAAIRKVAELVNVHSVVTFLQSLQFAGDCDQVANVVTLLQLLVNSFNAFV